MMGPLRNARRIDGDDLLTVLGPRPAEEDQGIARRDRAWPSAIAAQAAWMIVWRLRIAYSGADEWEWRRHVHHRISRCGGSHRRTPASGAGQHDNEHDKR